MNGIVCSSKQTKTIAAYIPSFLTATTERESVRREAVELIEYEICRLKEALKNSGKFRNLPDLYQDAYCFWSEQLKLFKGE
ncbi:MAG TPA: hypothetical protein DCR95_07235 [Desulfobacter sp.]|nr:hypothetical protein [Desulfobacter sp.]